MFNTFKEQTLSGLKTDFDYSTNPELHPVYERLLAVEPKTVADCYLLLGVQAKAERYYRASESFHTDRKAHLKETLDRALEHLTTLEG